jgi:hypothetical protein
MDTTEQDKEPFDDGSFDFSGSEAVEGQRTIIRLALDEIATELGRELQAGNINCKVFLTVPSSGMAFATIATPTDPPEDEWSRVMEIVCRLIGKRLGDIKLHGRALPCAMAHSRMNATEITSNTLDFYS